jgi:AcrR family transcriptional regulator
VSTVSEQPTRRTPLATSRGQLTQSAIGAATRRVIARKGSLAATVAPIAAEAGRSSASYSYYDSNEAMVCECQAVRPR